MYLAQKKSKLFASIFSPEPPTRDWITASEFGKPVRDKARSGWSKEAYLSSMDVFVASFLSGILFTSAIALLTLAIARLSFRGAKGSGERATDAPQAPEAEPPAARVAPDHAPDGRGGESET